jgi:photosystem II stability/assembly factor-like uncharacterized protein
MNIYFFLTVIILYSVSLFGQWIQLPQITSYNLKSISFAKEKGFISSQKEIFRSNDAGLTWKNVKSVGDFEYIYSAKLVNGDYGLSIGGYGDNNHIYSTTDNGNTWENINFGLPAKYSKVIFRGNTGWILGKIQSAENPLIKTTDGGTTWETLSSNRFEDIFFLNKDLGFATDGLWIYKTINGGIDWTVKYSSFWGGGQSGIYFINDSTGFAYGSGSIWTSDGGETWKEVQTSGMSAFFIDNSNGWIAGYMSMAKTTDGGVTWNKINLPIQDYMFWITSIYFKNINEGFVCTSDNEVFKTTDSGITWIKSTDVQARVIIFIDSITGYAGGNNNRIYKTLDGGDSWEQQLTQSSEFNNIISMDFINSDNGWAVGDQGLIYHTTNGGLEWEIKESSKIPIINAMSVIDSDNSWLGGENGIILKLSANGKYYKHQFSGTSNLINEICFIDKDNGFAITDKEVLKTTNGGKKWTKSILGDQGENQSIFFENNNVGWLLVDRSTYVHMVRYLTYIYKTTDGGNSWILNNIMDGMYNKIFFINETEGLLAGIKGTIMRSLDGGKTWISEQSGTTSNLNDIGMDEHIYIIGDNGVILQSEKTYTSLREENNNSDIKNFVLSQNYPNPFNSSTIINYSVKFPGNVTLKIYDALGREVVTLVNGEKTVGNHFVEFSAGNLSSGIYFCQMKSAGFLQTKKMILLK